MLGLDEVIKRKRKVMLHLYLREKFNAFCDSGLLIVEGVSILDS